MQTKVTCRNIWYLIFLTNMFLLSFSMRSHVIDTKCSFTVKTQPHRNISQPVLSKIGNYNPLRFLQPGKELDISMDRNYPIANKTTITQ